MKKILLGILILSSFSTFASEVCSVTQYKFEDFLIRCNNYENGEKLMKKLKSSAAGSKNDIVMIKMMLDSGYDLKTHSDIILNKDELSSTWVFSK